MADTHPIPLGVPNNSPEAAQALLAEIQKLVVSQGRTWYVTAKREVTEVPGTDNWRQFQATGEITMTLRFGPPKQPAKETTHMPDITPDAAEDKLTPEEREWRENVGRVIGRDASMALTIIDRLAPKPNPEERPKPCPWCHGVDHIERLNGLVRCKVHTLWIPHSSWQERAGT